MKNITVKVNAYCFDISKPAEAKKWEELKTLMESRGVELFDCIKTDHSEYSDRIKKLDGKIIEIDTGTIFNNQLNTKCGVRIFDFYQSIVPNERIKVGHYLTETDAVQKLRAETYACGYTGKQTTKPKGKYNLEGLKGYGLTDKQLHLLRWLPISSKKNREKLTDSEIKYLKPKFNKARLEMKEESRIKKIEEVKAYFDKKEKALEKEKAGKLWILKSADTSGLLNNMIYYSHTDTFCFGWSTSIKKDETFCKEVEKALKKFPYKYEIK